MPQYDVAPRLPHSHKRLQQQCRFFSSFNRTNLVFVMACSCPANQGGSHLGMAQFETLAQSKNKSKKSSNQHQSTLIWNTTHDQPQKWLSSCAQVAIGVWPAPWTPHHWRLPSQCAVLMRTPCIHCSSGGGRSGMCERAETKRTAVTAEIRILKIPKGYKVREHWKLRKLHG